MCEKLYYKDAYISEFTSVVTSCESADGGYALTLRETAFFPEAGGQGCDGGWIEGLPVTSVFESDGEIFHTVSSPLPVGTEVFCRLDFQPRYERMQCHTAEHMFSGTLHRLFGAENVGFHLSEREMTLDTDIPITRDELAAAEYEANLAVYRNIPVVAYYPTAEEAANVSYRSKGEYAAGELRLVRIDGVDVCACCAPHVRSTGETGIIKVLYSEKHKGGTRVYLSAGVRAYRILADEHETLRKISACLSAPIAECAEAVSKTVSNMRDTAAEYRAYRASVATRLGSTLPYTDGNRICVLHDTEPEALRTFADSAKERAGGLTLALSGEEGNYRYVLACRGEDIAPYVRALNLALSGRGGGRGEMAQGTLSSGIEKAEEHLGVKASVLL